MEGMDRREFLKKTAALGVSSLIPQHGEARETSDILPSTLTPERLAEDKRRAALSLAKSIPPLPALDYLRAYVPHLEKESQMYIPSREEVERIVSAGGESIRSLGTKLPPNEHGLFIFADEHDGVHFQRLYVLRKDAEGSLQFVKGYPVSAAIRGFGNEKDSNKTPLGLHTLYNGQQGLFGEVVSGLNKHKSMFNHVRYNGVDRWFVKDFGGEGGNDVAEVVTDQYLLHGPHTDVSRGIRLHGTNRSGRTRPDGSWQTYLGGRRRSGGCIRMSNTDIRDLSLSGYVHASPVDLSPKKREDGTYVMIYATERARTATLSPHDEAFRDWPKRWNEREAEQPITAPRERNPAREWPKRWNEGR